jgi:hypothetical protein
MDRTPVTNKSLGTTLSKTVESEEKNLRFGSRNLNNISSQSKEGSFQNEPQVSNTAAGNIHIAVKRRNHVKRQTKD